ncbi:MAG: DUF805 domain-containing protein [Magnetococcales bacterium]|nr:DUF805 domain-containing protein [Magnetococcales bacterium]
MNFFSFKFWLSQSGRVGRKAYLIGNVVLFFVTIAVGLVLMPGILDDADNTSSLSWFIMLLSIWPSIALLAKRLHDCDRSAWFALIIFIPLFGQLLLAYYTLFVKGTDGPNRFGADPLLSGNLDTQNALPYTTTGTANTPNSPKPSPIKLQPPKPSMPEESAITFASAKDPLMRALLFFALSIPGGLLFVLIYSSYIPIQIQVVASIIVLLILHRLYKTVLSFKYILTSTHLEIPHFIMGLKIPLEGINQITDEKGLHFTANKCQTSFDYLTIMCDDSRPTYISPGDEQAFLNALIERTSRLKRVGSRKLSRSAASRQVIVDGVTDGGQGADYVVTPQLAAQSGNNKATIQFGNKFKIAIYIYGILFTYFIVTFFLPSFTSNSETSQEELAQQYEQMEPLVVAMPPIPGDDDHQTRKKIVAIFNDIPGVELLLLEQPPYDNDSKVDAYDNFIMAQGMADRLRIEGKAQTFLWGLTMQGKAGGESRLYIKTIDGRTKQIQWQATAGGSRHAMVTPHFEPLLKLAIIADIYKFAEFAGGYPGDPLSSQINVVTALLAPGPGLQTEGFLSGLISQLPWQAQDPRQYQPLKPQEPQYHDISLHLATALTTLVSRDGGYDPLIEAVTLAEQALAFKPWQDDHKKLSWAGKTLGDALVVLAYHLDEPQHLERAISIYQQALAHTPRKESPLDWAKMQIVMANAMSTLGQQRSEPQLFEQAIFAYTEALQELTQERVPMEWARAQNSLGQALARLYGSQPTPDGMQQAVMAYRKALQIFTSQHTFDDWSDTKQNLGGALRIFGANQADSTILSEALELYRELLDIHEPDANIFLWSSLHQHIGQTFESLDDITPDTATLQEAIAAYRQATKVYNFKEYAYFVGMTQNDLGLALFKLGDRLSDVNILQEAIDAFNQSANGFGYHDEWYSDWASVQFSLGRALQRQGELISDETILYEAEAAYLEALSQVEVDSDNTPNKLWADIKTSLGKTKLAQGRISHDQVELDEAKSQLQAASKFYEKNENGQQITALTALIKQVDTEISLLQQSEQQQQRLE